MLQDQYRESSKIENEYRKLLQAWDHELSSKPPTDIKKSKINRSEHIQFTLMHLFSGYLDQIWTDSQNMLQCAQAWSNQNTETLPSDAIYTMNILGLHLMKQSLRTRQEFFRIVDELNEVSLEAESIFSASDSTISEEFALSHPAFYNHGYIDLEKEALGADQAMQRDIYNMGSYEPLSTRDHYMEDSASELVKHNRSVASVKLSNPPNPVIKSNTSEIQPNTQRFHSEVHNVNSGQLDQGRHVHGFFRPGPLPSESSFSSASSQSLKYDSVQSTDDEEDDKQEDNKSFGIASYYYNSESEYEEDAVEREFLIEKPIALVNDTNAISQSPADGRMKKAIKHSRSNSTSSSIIHYSVDTKQIGKNKVRRHKQLVHQRYNSSSTCLPRSTSSSVFSKSDESDSKDNMNVCDSSEKKTDMKSTYLSQMSKIASFFRKPSAEETTLKEKNDISAKNKFLFCNVFLARRDTTSAAL